MHHKSLLGTTFLMACLTSGPSLFPGETMAATNGEAGSDLWVDGPVAVQPGSDRIYPDAAVDPAGNLVFVWTVFNAAGGNNWDVFLRRFGANGEPLADPVRVNTLIDNTQRIPRVAISGDGSFLVIWQSLEQEPDAIPGVRRIFVRSQAFDSDGAPVGTEQLLSTLSTSEATDAEADVAALTGGGYVVVWSSRNSPGLTLDNYIQARLVTANGTPSGDQFKANSSDGPNVDQPAVTELADGGFLVVWAGSNVEVQGRRFLANGTPDGNDFQVNTFTTGTEADPDAALHSDGRVMVVWTDDEGIGESDEIRGRLFSSELTPAGSDFRINTLFSGIQADPKVGDYGKGGFFVVWESAVSAGNDITPRSIQGRIVTGSNLFVSSDFQVNRWIAGSQQQPGMSGRDGRIAVAWRSAGNEDTMEDVITAQHWSICGIFCDGFE
jgi:hypothetical protein